jgi:hypothetical protein
MDLGKKDVNVGSTNQSLTTLVDFPSYSTNWCPPQPKSLGRVIGVRIGVHNIAPRAVLQIALSCFRILEGADAF